MQPTAYSPCSRCGGPRHAENFKGADIVVCVNCGAITLNRNDLEQLAHKTNSDAGLVDPPAAANPFSGRQKRGGMTIIPDEWAELPALTASEPPPPPRSMTPPGGAPDLTIPREIEYFRQTPSGDIPAPSVVPAPTRMPVPLPSNPTPEAVPAAASTDDTFFAEDLDLPDLEPETHLFSGTMEISAPQLTDEFPMLTDEVPTSMAETLILTEDPETQESILPGNREIPPTPAFGADYLQVDEPFGGADFEDDPDDDFVEQYQAAQRKRWVVSLGIGVMALLAIGAPVAGFLGYQAYKSVTPGDPTLKSSVVMEEPKSTEPPADGAVADADLKTDTEPTVDAELSAGEEPGDGAPVDPAVIKDSPAEKAPDSPPVKKQVPPPAKKAPPAKKRAPKAPSVSGLVDSGWGAVGSDPGKALGLFKQALDINSSHADANYGYGYAQLQLGNAPGAKSYLCKASASGDVGVQREVKGLLTKNGLSCD